MPQSDFAAITVDMRNELMDKLVHTGILILQDERVKVGESLVTDDLAIGSYGAILGRPCLTLHGFTHKGFRYLQARDKLTLSRRAFDDPSKRPASISN